MGEQGKINRPGHTAGGSQNKGTEKLQRRAGTSPLEVGGRGEGKGANSAPEKRHPPTLQTGPRFLSKEVLRFWMVDIRCWEGRARAQLLANSSEQTQATGSACWGHGGKRRAAPRERAPKPLAAWAAEAGKTHTQAQPNPRFCGGPENWNRTQRRARSI